MKYCLFALVLLLRIVSLNAQDPNDPDDPYHDIDTINPFEVPLDILPAPCFVESIVACSEILLEDGSVLVYVRFQDETPGYIRVADALVGTQIYAEQYSDSEIIVQKAYANQKLRLYLINTCDEEIYYDISRVSEDASDQNVLNISPELGKLLEKYVARQVPLGEFLATT